MSSYLYKAKNTTGQYVTGVVEAQTKRDAINEVARLGMYPIDIKLAANSARGSLLDALPGIFTPKVKIPDLLMMCRQMYALTKSGVPIVNAIAGLAESTQQKALKESLFTLNKNLIGGKSLSSAMYEQPKVYSGLFVSLIHVGENTGRLESVFQQLASYFELEHETRKRISSAMRYPLFVVIFIAVAMVILNIFVIPVFAQMFAKFGVELPFATRILIMTSHFFVHYWGYLAGVVIAMPIIIHYLLRKQRIRYFWDKMKLKIPIIGSIINRALLGRFCRTFSLMLRANVPLNVALTLVAEALDNKYLERIVFAMRVQIEQGNALSIVTRQSNIFSPLVLQMFAVGDETGRVDELLLEAAEYYEREVDYDLKSLAARIEPLLLVVVAFMVAILALGIFTPMWDMYGAMQGK